LKQDFLSSSLASVLKNWAELLSSARIYENDALMLVFLINMHFDMWSVGLYISLRAFVIFLNRSPNSNYHFYENNGETYWLLLYPYARFRGDNHYLITPSQNQKPSIGTKLLFILWKWIHVVLIIAAMLVISQKWIFEDHLEVVQENQFPTFQLFFALNALGLMFDQLASRINLEQIQPRKQNQTNFSLITRQWMPIVMQFVLMLWLVLSPERLDPGLFNFKWCIDISCALTLISCVLFTLHALVV
jgi:hypothetical protein